MSSQPECQKCGVYVNYGPVVCDACRGKRDAAVTALVEAAEDTAYAIEQGDCDNATKLAGLKLAARAIAAVEVEP